LTPFQATFFLYLNDVEEGGGTEFRHLSEGPHTVIPKRGRAALWHETLSFLSFVVCLLPFARNPNYEDREHRSLTVVEICQLFAWMKPQR
jgi:hypothetical protein